MTNEGEVFVFDAKSAVGMMMESGFEGCGRKIAFKLFNLLGGRYFTDLVATPCGEFIILLIG